MEQLKALIAKLTWQTLVVIVGLGGAFFYYTLDRSEVEQIKGEIDGATTQIEDLNRKIAEAKKFELEFEAKKKILADLNRQLAAMQGALPTAFQVPDLLQDLVREARNIEFEITSIQPDVKEEAQELFNTLGFNIEFRGIYHQAFIFLDRLSKLKRLVNVIGVSLNRDGARTEISLGGENGLFAEQDLGGGLQAFPAVQGKLRLLAYRYKPEPVAAPAAATPPPGGLPPRGRSNAPATP